MFFKSMIRKLKDIQIDGRVRFFLPIAIVAVIKLFSFAWVQQAMIQNPENFADHQWWQIFGRWDAGWYNIIARNWYETTAEASVSMLFAFPPAYPTVIRVLGIIIGNFTASQVSISLFFGFLWIPLFQLVAEQYFSKRESFLTTVIAALFPSVFLFTSVGYSEGLFITLILLSWLLYLKGRKGQSALAAAGASLTRFIGIILILPMLIESFRRRDAKSAVLYTAPTLIAQIGWAFYGFLKTDSVFAFFEAHGNWINKLFLNQYVAPTLLQSEPTFPFNVPYPEAVAAFEIAFVAIFILIIIKIHDIDWRLLVYSSFSFLFIVLTGNIGDYVRYLSFLFPVWFIFRSKSLRLLIPIVGLLGFCDLLYMYLFARWVFL